MIAGWSGAAPGATAAPARWRSAACGVGDRRRGSVRGHDERPDDDREPDHDEHDRRRQHAVAVDAQQRRRDLRCVARRVREHAREHDEHHQRRDREVRGPAADARDRTPVVAQEQRRGDEQQRGQDREHRDDVGRRPRDRAGAGGSVGLMLHVERRNLLDLRRELRIATARARRAARA